MSASYPSPFDAPSPRELDGYIEGIKVEEFIGAGGMGAVYKGIQTSLDRPVAIKIMPGYLMADKDGPERFRREARVLAKLSHVNLVPVHDFGDFETHSGEVWYYYVMSFIDGPNLMSLADGDLPNDRALQILFQVFKAISYAHEQGVIHRDIKPENILIGSDGAPKVADFGLAKIENASLASELHTREGSSLGSIHFSAPEQIDKDGQTDHRADIYSLGILSYLLLTKKLPRGRFDKPSAFGLHSSFDQAIERAIHTDPEKRYQSVGEMDEAFAKASDQSKSRRLPKSWIVAAIAVLFCAGLAGIVWSVSSSEDRPAGTVMSNSYDIELVWAPAGEFLKGSPPTEEHRWEQREQLGKVTLTNGFWIGKYEITQEQYHAVTGFKPSEFIGDNLPVEQVTWRDAMDFCTTLTKMEKKRGTLPDGWVYDLPTEAQWEYACRAGDSDPSLPFHDDLEAISWNIYNSGNATKPIGTKKPNAWEIHDMYGNVREWCKNWWAESNQHGVDPKGPSTGVQYPTRGGCCTKEENECRAAWRQPNDTDNKHWDIGFRIVLRPEED